LAIAPFSEVPIDPALHRITGAMAMCVVSHECSGHSADGALHLAFLSQLGSNAALSIGHEGFRHRTSVGKTELIICPLKSDAAIFAVDARADKEGLTPSRSNSHTKARKQLVPVIDLTRSGGLQP